MASSRSCRIWSGSEPRRSTAAPTASTCTGRIFARRGESEQRLYGLDAWEESPYYSDRERAALAWTEAVTRLDGGHVSDPVFQAARRFFSEKELADLTLCIVAINGWNRFNIAFHAPAGTYQPAPKARTAPSLRRTRPEASH